MTVPMEKNGGEKVEQNNGKSTEGTPLLSAFRKSISAVSNRSVRFDDDEDSSRRSVPQTGSQGRPSLHPFRSASSYLEHFTQSERDRALKQPGVGKAAFLIRDAVLGTTENPSEGTYNPYENPDTPLRNTTSILCRRVCASRSFRKVIYGVVWILVLLSFFEPPAWCFDIPGLETSAEDAIDAGHCHRIMELSGPPADDPNSKQHVEYYPNATVFLLSKNHAVLYEYICLIVLLFDVLLLIGRDGCSPAVFFRKGRARVPRVVMTLSILSLMISLMIANARRGYHTRVFAPFFRIAILVSLSVNSRRELRTIIHLMPEVFSIVFLLFVLVGFYAWMGVVTFYGSSEGEQHFPNIIDAMWTLWIMVTTANYPDVMMPAYNESRLAAIYFVVFMILTFFFLMNVILASVVNAYDNELDRRKIAAKEMSQQDLKEAFQLMQQNGEIDRETVMALFMILNDDFPEFRTIPKDEARLLFALLDKDGSNKISEDEFMNFTKVMLVEFDRASSYETVIQKRFPTIYDSLPYQRFCRFIKSDLFEGIIDFVLVLNAVVIAIQSYPELAGEYVVYDPKSYNGKIDTPWEIVETIFTIIYVLEASVKIMVLGWKRYSQSPKNIFDFIVTALAAWATAYVYIPNAYSNSRLIRYIVMARVLRLSRLLFALKPFQLIAKISLDILPLAGNIILILWCILYLFAALGMFLYGGMITRDPGNSLSYLLLETDFSDNAYWSNNFNDMFSSMNVLFNLLVVNNWTTEWIGIEAVTESKVCRLYFLFFYIFGVILVNNVVVAFIVNSFIDGWDRQHELDEHEEVGGEAVMEGRQAVFDASHVTGTATFLTGTYIAKLRRRAAAHQSVRNNNMLKNLFTQTESKGDEDDEDDISDDGGVPESFGSGSG